MVHATADQSTEGKRLRVGMVGGGRNAFIGAVHRHLAKVRIGVVVPDLDTGERCPSTAQLQWWLIRATMAAC